MRGVISILYVIQFRRILRAPVAPTICAHTLDGTTAKTDTSGPAFRQNRIFLLEVKPAGMLAREVQATTIEHRVILGLRGVNGRKFSQVTEGFPGDFMPIAPVYASSAYLGITRHPFDQPRLTPVKSNFGVNREIQPTKVN